MEPSEYIAIGAIVVALGAIFTSIYIFDTQRKKEALSNLRMAHLQALQIGLQNPSFLGVSQSDIVLPDGSKLSGDEAKKYTMYVYFLLNVIEQSISNDVGSSDWRALLSVYAKIHTHFLSSMDANIKHSYSEDLRGVLREELPGVGW